MTHRIFAILASVAMATGCSGGGSSTDDSSGAGGATDIVVTDAELAGNPFIVEWTTPHGMPPFDAIRAEHYQPAFNQGVLERREQIEAIASNPAEPTFSNTIVALEAAGELFTRVIYTFANVRSTEMDDKLRAVEADMLSLYTRETDATLLNDDLFRRVQAVYEQRESLDLSEQDARLLELTHRAFVRAGAALDTDTKQKVADINARISELNTKFAQNLLLATKAFTLTITDEDDLAGLPADFRASIRDDDKNAWVVGLNRSAYETFMTQSDRRELREELFNAYQNRAAGGEYDNGPVLIEIARLRAERAALMGYASHAHYQLETRMAKTPEGAVDFLLRVWRPGLERAKEERADMQAMVGDAFTIAAHDWWYYTDKVRKARYDFDGNALKPYFELNAVRGGAFELANRLFGLRFEAADVPVWHPTVTAYEVYDDDDSFLGVLGIDVYARDSKRSGAWMNNYRDASNINGDNVRPIVTMNLNLPQPPEGEPTLMRFSDVETFFHEFGHSLHGLMTRIDYPSFSGVSGPRDYTEFPAQILEHWPGQGEMLELYARHYVNGEVIPQDLIEKMRAAANFNQGFATTEYIAASLLDLSWHSLTAEQAAQIDDAMAFEEQVLDEYGLIDEIEPRYRSPYFNHIFASGYSAGYYAYLWSEILDADGFDVFKQSENLFDPASAARLKQWIYQAGGLREADELYRNFRGSDPNIEPLLRGRGFAVEEQSDD